jgi:hypothetical protein
MIDRRGFLGLMLGAAVVPKDVLSGLATPEPVKNAWIQVHRFEMPDGSIMECIAEFKLAFFSSPEDA